MPCNLVRNKQRRKMATTESERIVGYIEVYNIDKDGEWTDLNDIPFITTVNCQLCNEPTEAHDIIIPAVIQDGILTAGTWQCRKCKAVNG